MHLARYAAITVGVACLLIPGSAAGFDGTVLRGFGTAAIDGVQAPGEWNPAGNVNFTVNRAAEHGGGTVPATLYVMNDATNLYIAVKVDNASVAASTAAVFFDGDHDNSTAENGEDIIRVDPLGFFLDRFYRQGEVTDTADGGTSDGDERDGDGPGYSFYEFSHPLDSADNAHDFSLRPPMRIGFRLRFQHCAAIGSCASSSSYPLSQLAEIVIVTGNRVPPDTQVTSGPAEGSGSNKTNPTFQFTGTDDVLQPTELTFECKTDADAWEACTSPKRLVDVDDGRHTFSVRAVDEMLNVDQSPVQRNWTMDDSPPSRPVVRGRRSVRQGQWLVLRFSATDAGIGGVYFRCSVDSGGLKRCPARYRRKLAPGRHVLTVRAYDRIGNSAQTRVRVTVKRTRR